LQHTSTARGGDTLSRKERLAQTNYWDAILALRDEQREHRKTAVQVIKESELPLEVNRQGLMRWYLHPEIKDTILSTLMIYSQEIPPGSRSGRFKFQGDQVIYVVEGRGYSLIDGVRHPWKAGDCLNLPLRKAGVVVQHVNPDPEQTAKLIAVEPNLLACASVDRGSGFEQLEDAPEYRKSKD
jgi:quercetin dioxygenase-like cupin family protein